MRALDSRTVPYEDCARSIYSQSNDCVRTTAGQEDPFELDSNLLLSSGQHGEDRKRQCVPNYCAHTTMKHRYLMIWLTYCIGIACVSKTRDLFAGVRERVLYSDPPSTGRQWYGLRAFMDDTNIALLDYTEHTGRMLHRGRNCTGHLQTGSLAGVAHLL